MIAIQMKCSISKCYLATSKFQPISSNNLSTENSNVPFTSHFKAAQLFYIHTHTEKGFGWEEYNKKIYIKN